jgi:hypothetical protein
MSFASKVLYTGDGIQTNFNIPFSYISTSHIRVFVDEILQLNPMNYTLSGASTVVFGSAPGDQSAIEIKRESSPTATIVDFQDGSVLRETDLDTAYLHNFYLTQEYADSFNEIINEALVNIASGAGIVETETDAVIAALVNEMLADENAANLQARITDIDANAEAIITLGEGLQVQINTLAQGVAANVYLDDEPPVPGVPPYPDPIAEGARWYDTNDNNAPYIYVSSVWTSIEDPRIGQAAADITVLEATVDHPTTGVVANTAAIVAEGVVRANADTAFGQTLALIGAETDAGAAFLLDLNTVKVGASETLADRFTTITASDGTLQANITTEETARVAQDNAIATTFSLMGAENGTGTAFILNENTVKIASDGGDTVAQRFTALSAADSANAASITTINTVTIPGINSNIDSIEAEYGVDLDVNGYITGFRIINGGTPGASAFVIRSDTFAIVDTTGDGLTEYVPFEISGGKINFRADVKIDGNLMVTGSINGATALSTIVSNRLGSTHIGTNAIYSAHISAGEVKTVNLDAGAVTAGKITVTDLNSVNANTGQLTVNASGHIKGGQTAYDTGSGFFLGDSSGYKFSIGDGANNSLTWDGTTLTATGKIYARNYVAGTIPILSADTERTVTDYHGTGWEKKKEFTLTRKGTIRLSMDVKSDPDVAAIIVILRPYYKVMQGATTLLSQQEITQESYTTKTHDITITDPDDGNIEIWMICGDAANIIPSYHVDLKGWVRNCRMQNTFYTQEAVITD